MSNSIARWVYRNSTGITWFFVGMMVSNGIHHLSQGNYFWAAVNFFFAYVNYALSKLRY